MNSARNNMYDFVADLEKNIAAEATARQDYYIILKYWYDELELAEVEQIKEIIAEELKHTEILRNMIEKRTKIIGILWYKTFVYIWFLRKKR